MLEDDKNLLMLLCEISDLQKIAKLNSKRKQRTAPGVEGQNTLIIEMDRLLEEHRKRAEKVTATNKP